MTISPATFDVIHVGGSADFDTDESATSLPAVSLNTTNKSSKPGTGPQLDDAKQLPFGLQRCDVPQTLKRDGFKKAVTIKNEDHWK